MQLIVLVLLTLVQPALIKPTILPAAPVGTAKPVLASMFPLPIIRPIWTQTINAVPLAVILAIAEMILAPAPTTLQTSIVVIIVMLVALRVFVLPRPVIVVMAVPEIVNIALAAFAKHILRVSMAATLVIIAMPMPLAPVCLIMFAAMEQLLVRKKNAIVAEAAQIVQEIQLTRRVVKILVMQPAG